MKPPKGFGSVEIADSFTVTPRADTQIAPGRFTFPKSAAMFAAFIMDKFWSICCMPIGVAVCFGPVLVAWWLAERRDAKSENGEARD